MRTARRGELATREIGSVDGVVDSSVRWIVEAVSAFGAEAKAKLAGPGEREALIRTPIEHLLTAAGRAIEVPAIFHDEIRDDARQVRPDYGVSVQGAIIGYVEVKAPGRSVNPESFHGHDLVQWNRQKDLPNLIYTNGTEWRLYRDGEIQHAPVRLSGDLTDAGPSLSAPYEFEKLLGDFLRWKPAPITNVSTLVRAIAPLTRLLRGEVLDQLEIEKRALAVGGELFSQPFSGLAQDWRGLLFPSASDDQFADGYAQTVSFALLLARIRGIDLSAEPLHEVGAKLGASHSLMGRALQLLTDDVAQDFKVTLDLLVRVIGAVDWSRIREGRRDTYLYLYEDFLTEYDPKLRQRSGSYYTPHEIVGPMTRLVEEVLVTRLGKQSGFADDGVYTVDPAMGTGTYLQTVLERVADSVEADEGPGAVAHRLGDVAARMAGFEIQMGPFAVAQLRTAELLADKGALPPPGGMHLYVTDTLDDPNAAQQQLASGLALIAQSRIEANKVKASQPVTVVLGNPPYGENAAAVVGLRVVVLRTPATRVQSWRTFALLGTVFTHRI
jgi:N-6 DNA Methylase